MSAKVTLQTFAPVVGDGFRVEAGEGITLELELAEVSAAGDGAGREPFTLLFRGPTEPVLPQGTYGFEHPSLGRIEVFIVPIGSNADGVSYEAIYA